MVKIQYVCVIWPGYGNEHHVISPNSINEFFQCVWTVEEIRFLAHSFSCSTRSKKLRCGAKVHFVHSFEDADFVLFLEHESPTFFRRFFALSTELLHCNYFNSSYHNKIAKCFGQCIFRSIVQITNRIVKMYTFVYCYSPDFPNLRDISFRIPSDSEKSCGIENYTVLLVKAFQLLPTGKKPSLMPFWLRSSSRPARLAKRFIAFSCTNSCRRHVALWGTYLNAGAQFIMHSYRVKRRTVDWVYSHFTLACDRRNVAMNYFGRDSSFVRPGWTVIRYGTKKNPLVLSDYTGFWAVRSFATPLSSGPEWAVPNILT